MYHLLSETTGAERHKIPTNREWREVQIADSHHSTDPAPNDKIVFVNGVKHIEREYLGVKIVLPA